MKKDSLYDNEVEVSTVDLVVTCCLACALLVLIVTTYF